MASLKIGQIIKDHESEGENGIIENIENDGTVLVRWMDEDIIEEFESEWVLLKLTSNEHLIND